MGSFFVRRATILKVPENRGCTWGRRFPGKLIAKSNPAERGEAGKRTATLNHFSETAAFAVPRHSSRSGQSPLLCRTQNGAQTGNLLLPLQHHFEELFTRLVTTGSMVYLPQQAAILLGKAHRCFLG